MEDRISFKLRQRWETISSSRGITSPLIISEPIASSNHTKHLDAIKLYPFPDMINPQNEQDRFSSIPVARPRIPPPPVKFGCLERYHIDELDSWSSFPEVKEAQALEELHEHGQKSSDTSGVSVLKTAPVVSEQDHFLTIPVAIPPNPPPGGAGLGLLEKRKRNSRNENASGYSYPGVKRNSGTG